MNATVFKPMEMTVAETVLKEAKQILDELGIVFFCGTEPVWEQSERVA